MGRFGVPPIGGVSRPDSIRASKETGRARMESEPVEGHDHARDDVTPPHRCHACGGYVTKHAADPETFVPGGYFCDDCGEAAK